MMGTRSNSNDKMQYNTCRTCAKLFNEVSSLSSIFEESIMKDCKFLIIHELILLNVKVEEDDGLPQQICINCVKRLTDVYTFRELCKESYETLKNQFLKTIPSQELQRNTNANNYSEKVEQETEENNIQHENISNYKNADHFFEEGTYSNDDDDIASNFSDFFPDIKKSEKKDILINKNNSDVDSNDDDEIYQLSIKRDVQKILEDLKLLEDMNESKLNRSKRKRKSDVNKEKVQSHDEDDDDDSDFDDDNGSNFSDDLPLIRKKTDSPIWHKKKNIPNSNKNNKSTRPPKPTEKSEKKIINTDPVQQCKECNKYCRLATLKYHKFSCANLLKAEQHFSVQESEFHCFYCDEKFDSQEIITDHILNTHPKNRPFQCTFCKEHFQNLRRRNTHIEIHNASNSAVCQICQKGFRTKANLKKHLLLNHTINNNHECSICYKIYDTNKKFKRHMKKCHGKNVENTDNDNNERKIYKCDLCSKEYNRESYYNMHMNVHNNVVIMSCDICGKGGFQNQKTLNEHKTSHNDMYPFQCEFCGKQFRLIGSLNGHIAIHTGQHPRESSNINKRSNIFYYDCPKCPRRFRIQTAFEKHIKVHSEERQYQCSECNHAYIRSEHLKRHIDKVHLKNRKYACSLCTLTFMDAYTRNNHEKTFHTTEKLPCKYCNKVFKNQRCKDYHEQGHIGIKPFKCQICGEGYPDPSTLKGHLTKHTPEEHEAAKAKILADNLMS